MKNYIPTLNGNKYANLVTAFAVIIAVEYSTGSYDAWDILIGVLSMILGVSFIKDAKEKKDYWYSFLTSGLISLGIICIISSLIFICLELGFSIKEPDKGIYKFFYELFRVGLFLILNKSLTKKYLDQNISTKST